VFLMRFSIISAESKNRKRRKLTRSSSVFYTTSQSHSPLLKFSPRP
jgi:hypothetical protein